jgi:hypothetical protein
VDCRQRAQQSLRGERGLKVARECEELAGETQPIDIATGLIGQAHTCKQHYGAARADGPAEALQPRNALLETGEVTRPSGEPHPGLLDGDTLRTRWDTGERAICGVE